VNLGVGRWQGGLAFAVVATLATGCGVPSSDGPQALPSDVVAIGPSPADSTPANATVKVGVAWIEDRRLAVVDRLVAGDNRVGWVNAALGALVGGPNAVEQETGLTTLVPPDAILTAQLAGRRAVVNLDLGSASVNQSMAVGQVALTTLSVRGVRSVLFTVNGIPTSVPLPGGKSSDGPVTARDYRASIAKK
jgi:hypothetical protein